MCGCNGGLPHPTPALSPRADAAVAALVGGKRKWQDPTRAPQVRRRALPATPGRRPGGPSVTGRRSHTPRA
eukprot:762958-Hanusia_phi.AAC.1